MNNGKILSLVASIKALSYGTDQQKYFFAKILHTAKTQVDWSLTNWETFYAMVAQEITNTNLEVHQLIYGYGCLQKFSYAQKDQLRCLNALGWARFVAATQKQNKKIPVDEFIKAYLKVPMYKLVTDHKPTPSGDRAYGFSLPVESANKLDGILTQHGMTILNGRRHGVRDAVLAFLDTI